MTRKDTAELIISHYSKLRSRLPASDAEMFDKAIALMEELTNHESLNCLILDTALCYGLAAIGFKPLVKAQMMPAASNLLAQLVALNDEIERAGQSVH